MTKISTSELFQLIDSTIDSNDSEIDELKKQIAKL